MGPEGFRPAIRRCRTFFTAVMPDPDKVSTFSHLPDTTRLFAPMLFMEVTVRLQVRALCASTPCITDVLGVHIALSPTDLTRT